MTTAHKLPRRSFLRLLIVAVAVALSLTAPAADTTGTLVGSGGTSVTTTAVDPAAPGTHRVLSANILLASPANESKPTGWAHRRAFAVQTMKHYNPDIICLQEVLKGQAEDMAAAFPDFHHFGFPDAFMDKNSVGYHGLAKNLVLFRKDRYDLMALGNFWLSETPLIAGSRSWDSQSPRHVNWVRLKDRATGRQFRVASTHLDHRGQTARENAAKMLNEEAAHYASDFPQILGGDFNAPRENPAIKILEEGGWVSAYTAVHGPDDPGKTFHNLLGPKHNPKVAGNKIDFIFTRGAAKPVQAVILKDHENGRYPSDHYFLLADIELTTPTPAE